MDGNSLNVKPEPLFNHVFSATLNNNHDSLFIHPVSNSNLHECKQILGVQPERNQSRNNLTANFFDRSGYTLPVVTKVDFYSPGQMDHAIKESCMSGSMNDALISAPLDVDASFTKSMTVMKDCYSDSKDSVDTSTTKHATNPVKPSEALFVRALIGRCKRIAPLWFRGVSSMRERNREENRRMASNSGQSQSDWSLIGRKIAEMDAAAETDAVANLLKKLYKELPTDSVFWFLKCWLCSEDSLKDPDSCVISRGDAKGRMRRIDGGKGSDKVWRLDTIVGMLYHGLPMSSTDTNIMVHTCDQELCVRPQHIRFRASSVALVVVLKALAQAGYTVIPPSVPAGPNGVAPNASDESVDVFGPFTIDELQRYRTENLKPVDEPAGKLSLSATDREFANSIPVVRAALQSCVVDANLNGYHCPPGPMSNDISYARQQKVSPLNQNLGCSLPAPAYSTNVTTYHSLTANIPSMVDMKPSVPLLRDLTCLSSSNTLPVQHRAERRSMKRPAPSDSPCSFSSSPSSSRPRSHHPPTTSPPLLIPDTAAPSLHPQCGLRGSGTILQAPVPTPATLSSHLLSLNSPATDLNNATIRFAADSDYSIDHSKLFRSTGVLQATSGSPAILHQPFPLHHPGQHVSPALASVDGLPSSNSGKSTPRQPAKKRLEARTPTIEGLDDVLGPSIASHTNPSPHRPVEDSGFSSGMVVTVSTTSPSASSAAATSAFRVHQNTPFVPVLCRSGRPSSSGSSSAASGGASLTASARLRNDSTPMRRLSGVDTVSVCDTSEKHPRLNNTNNTSAPGDPEEEEEEEELMGIMVGRSSGGLQNVNGLHTPADGSANAQSSQPVTSMHCDSATAATKLSLALSSSYPQLGASPSCERNAIKMIGALLANSYGSPSVGNSTPVNPRRSASACSLPFVGSSPMNNHNPDSREPLANMWANLPISADLATPARRPDSLRKLLDRPMASTPPPRLSPSGLMIQNENHATDISNTPHSLSLSQTSGKEFMSFVRNSPASGITPELVDVLYNMAQQYGICQPRAGSRASRPSSQVAQHFYRSLVNGSVCGSPYLNNPTTTGMSSNCTVQSVNSVTLSTSLLSPSAQQSCCPSSALNPSHPLHQLRALSITPLAVDPEPVVSLSEAYLADPSSRLALETAGSVQQQTQVTSSSQCSKV